MEPPRATPKISLHHRLVRLLHQLNLYTENEHLAETDQKLSTRLYVILLAAGLLILICFISIIPQTRIVTIANPSVAEFDHFVESRGITPNCRCFQTSLRFNTNFIPSVPVILSTSNGFSTSCVCPISSLGSLLPIRTSSCHGSRGDVSIIGLHLIASIIAGLSH